MLVKNGFTQNANRKTLFGLAGKATEREAVAAIIAILRVNESIVIAQSIEEWR